MEPRGIGGWLIVPMIGLFLAILQGVLKVIMTLEVIGGKAMMIVVSPDGAHYHPVLASLIVFDLVGQTVLLIAAIVLLVLFSRNM